MYKNGVAGIKYKIVPKSWRECVPVRNYRNKKPPTNQMVLDLLAGKTVFAYGPNRSVGSLYAVAASNGKILRMYQFDDLDDDIYKGYVMWMDDRESKL
jgi:hypothetical protein